MNDEMLTAWEESKKQTTPELRAIFKTLAKKAFDKYNEADKFKYEYWVESYIIEGMLKHRGKYNPEKGREIYSYFAISAASFAVGIVHKMTRDESLSSVSSS